jgi:hypothetical protein
MKNRDREEIRPEYDFTGGVRGKYVARLAKGSNVVVLDQDVASIFPDSAAVNEALRALATVIQARQQAKRGLTSASTRTRRKRSLRLAG